MTVDAALAKLAAAAERAGRPFDPEAARRAIELAVAPCDDRPPSATGRQRRDHYAKLLDAVRAVREGYEEFLSRPGLSDPLVWAWGEPDWTHVEGEVQRFLETVRIHERWLAVAAEQAAGSVSAKGGRPRGSVLPEHRAVYALVEIWLRHVGEPAGYSQPIGGGNLRGPFVRFALAASKESRVGVTKAHIKSVLDSYDREIMRVRAMTPEKKFGPIESD